MTISFRNGVLEIKDVSIDNPLVAEYLESLPANEREQAVVDAIGLGVMAAKKGELKHFLDQTEGELGKHFASLKALYELRDMRFQTSGKGSEAEEQVMAVLNDFTEKAGFPCVSVSAAQLAVSLREACEGAMCRVLDKQRPHCRSRGGGRVQARCGGEWARPADFEKPTQHPPRRRSTRCRVDSFWML